MNIRKKRRRLELDNLEHRQMLTTLVDLDGDSDVDVLAGGVWLENDGKGNFSSHRFAADDVLSIYGDVDGDGDFDLVTSEPSWIENVDGNFSVAREFEFSGAEITEMRLTDVGGDGDLDLIATNRNHVILFSNDGQAFLQQAQYPVRDDVLSVTDFDHDGDLDFLGCDRGEADWACDNHELWLDRTMEDQSFQRQTWSTTDCFGIDSVLVRPHFIDFDGDGWDDVLYQFNNGDVLMCQWLAPNSQGEFGETRLVFDGSLDFGQVTYHDVDGDGDLDRQLYTALYFGPEPAVTSRWVELNHDGDFVYGGTGFGSRDTEDLPFRVINAEIADLNHDGIFDLYLGDGRWFNGLSRRLHDAELVVVDAPVSHVSFVPTRLDSYQSWPSFADFDGDGRNEVVTVSDGKWVIRTDRDGDGVLDEDVMFQFEAIIFPFQPTRSLAQDADGDGDLDLVSFGRTRFDWYAVFFENTDGQGTFVSRYPYLNVSVPSLRTWQVVDLEADGDLDYVMGGQYEENLTVFVNDNGVLSQYTLFTGYSASFTIQDIDGDGDADIGTVDAGAMKWFINENGSFGPPVAGDGVREAFAFANDGEETWLLALRNESSIYRQTGQEIQLVQTQEFYSDDLHWRDLDGDGDQDLIEVTSQAISWFEQTDDGLFPFRRIIASSNFDAFSDVEFLDWDHDGDLDVLARDSRGWILFEQVVPGDSNGDGQFDSADLVQAFQFGLYESDQTASFSQGDWNGDGRFDSGDFVHVFQIGSYQRDLVAAAVLAKSDLVTAADFDHAPKRNKNPRQTASVRLPMPATPFVS